MIQVVCPEMVVHGLTEAERDEFHGLDDLRKAELASIRRFIEARRELLTGRVLDFGAGKPGTCRNPQPYKSLVTGEYCPYDLGDPNPGGDFDVVLCTAVMQYLDAPQLYLNLFRLVLLAKGGTLIMAYNTNWPEVEESDLYRYTKSGMAWMVRQAGFIIGHHEPRCALVAKPNTFVTGYELVAAVNR